MANAQTTAMLRRLAEVKKRTTRLKQQTQFANAIQSEIAISRPGSVTSK